MLGLDRWLDPHVEQYLLTDDDEYIVDQVVKHPMAIVWPGLRFVLGLLLVVLATYAGAPFGWVLGLIGLGLAVQAAWKICDEQMDRFVITNMRAFRVHGLFSRHRATTPMTRILDITVNQSLMGRIFNYGHFIFESAAQDQGLREIDYVGRPDERDRTIQTVIQRAGLRASSPRWVEDTDS
ncbi:MAG TPA: PH domain-containing protein [Microlunatus sp.]|nr:PH domain-containing protein [Microlunatus sp.]